jgi:TRAP-type mannitol/chloroaromatic compound transport system permease large subunit
VLEDARAGLAGLDHHRCDAIWCVLATFQLKLQSTVRESVFLTAKTSAMVCWLFVGSSIFSAAFALLGGQDVVENGFSPSGSRPSSS